jgi:hypothetical protein
MIKIPLVLRKAGNTLTPEMSPLISEAFWGDEHDS